MDYTIIETIIDMAGKYRIKVAIDENNAQIFKFHHNPTQQEVNEAVKNYIILQTEPSEI